MLKSGDKSWMWELTADVLSLKLTSAVRYDSMFETATFAEKVGKIFARDRWLGGEANTELNHADHFDLPNKEWQNLSAAPKLQRKSSQGRSDLY